MDTLETHHSQGLGKRILIAMLIGVIAGIILKSLPDWHGFVSWLVNDVFKLVGQLFIRLITMLVVPIVFVSLTCGSQALGDLKQVGRVGWKTLAYYLLTTALAIVVALFFSYLVHLGHGMRLPTNASFSADQAPSVKEVVLNIVPLNPIKALADGIMLQIILFSLLFGVCLASLKNKTQLLSQGFEQLNCIFMKMILMIMSLAPYGVFCLLASLFATQGFALIFHLMHYFVMVLFVLFFQWVCVYGGLLFFVCGLNPLVFYRKIIEPLVFAFSVSSSNASIPVVLKTTEMKLGVPNKIASFIIPLGATINMDGTAIMQGVATVFIANIYHISLGFTGYLIVIAMATLASIGTAGVPGVGLITLSMVLQQVHLPVEGIALIIGVDRLLDMVRTAVNVTGDMTVSCLVAHHEKVIDREIFNEV